MQIPKPCAKVRILPGAPSEGSNPSGERRSGAQQEDLLRVTAQAVAKSGSPVSLTVSGWRRPIGTRTA